MLKMMLATTSRSCSAPKSNAFAMPVTVFSLQAAMRKCVIISALVICFPCSNCFIFVQHHIQLNKKLPPLQQGV
jgi:hypothetical protein